MARKSGGGTGRFKSATGRQKSATGRQKSATGKFKRSTGRMKPARSARRPKLSGHALVPVICSECYEELLFDTGVQSGSILCPVCEHESDRPDDARLHHIAEKRRQEKSGFGVSLILSLLGLGAFFFWGITVQSPANAASDGLFYAPLSVAGLCALALVGFIFKYERNRWETYF